MFHARPAVRSADLAGRGLSLIINRVYGADDKWSAAQATNLTYCVSTKFGSDYTAVKNAMANGAGQWEGASSRINFVHPKDAGGVLLELVEPAADSGH